MCFNNVRVTYSGWLCSVALVFHLFKALGFLYAGSLVEEKRTRLLRKPQRKLSALNTGGPPGK